MRDQIRAAGIAALIALAGPATAQEAAEGDSPAQPQAYVKETFQDWRMTCAQVEGGREACNMQQLMQDRNGNPVAQVTLAALGANAAPAVAAIEFAAPLETLLSSGLRLRIDDGQQQRYPFTFCTPQACVVRAALNAQQIAQYKAGAKADVAITPLAAPDQTVDLTLSLSGFTAAFDALQAQLGN